MSFFPICFPTETSLQVAFLLTNMQDVFSWEDKWGSPAPHLLAPQVHMMSHGLFWFRFRRITW